MFNKKESSSSFIKNTWLLNGNHQVGCAAEKNIEVNDDISA
jgi:hypothetical protein